ncbi:MAG: amino acid ABC transporter permease [Sciscionella sp.]
MNRLHEVPGPRARRRQRIAELACALVLAALAYLVIARLADHGAFAADAWAPFAQPGLWRLLGEGIGNNLRAAAVGMVLSLGFGVLLALGLLTRRGALRWPIRWFTELFRSIPLLLLLYFISLVLPSYGLKFSDFWFLVIALTLYNSAVIADIVRAGIIALPRGQTEASYTLGFGPVATMRYVVLPQVARSMAPSLVSQLVILFKGTALAFVLGGYLELLHSANIVGQYFTGSLLQALFVAAALFMAVNLALSRVARWLESRERRRYHIAAVPVAESGLRR